SETCSKAIPRNIRRSRTSTRHPTHHHSQSKTIQKTNQFRPIRCSKLTIACVRVCVRPADRVTLEPAVGWFGGAEGHDDDDDG
uniref:Uncharacterized protein n=1 Tax=Anopheles albimanus TaxID=7167 RepID=A0A182FZI7_ANOAL